MVILLTKYTKNGVQTIKFLFKINLFRFQHLLFFSYNQNFNKLFIIYYEIQIIF
jgi:hypothetical protein